jgi:hypothetical protein
MDFSSLANPLANATHIEAVAIWHGLESRDHGGFQNQMTQSARQYRFDLGDEIPGATR